MILLNSPTHALVALVAMLLLCLYLVPTFVALARDVAAKTPVIVVNLALGWTGAGWLWALILAFGPRLSAPVAQPASTAYRPRPRAGRSIYRDGVYLVSSGPESHTWAIREQGVWRIVYEIGGDERLVGEVHEEDIPLTVLAAALEPSEGAE